MIRARSDDTGGRNQRPYICPECEEEYGKPEPLGPHIERHRPLRIPVYRRKRMGCPDCAGNGCISCAWKGKRWGRKLVTLLCLRGCGRFLKGGLETAEHMANCDGSSPLETDTHLETRTA